MAGLLAACGETESPPPSGDYLVRVENIRTLDVHQVRAQLKNHPAVSVNPLLIDLLATQGVRVLKLTYRTPNPEGQIIEVSGALILPEEGNAPLPLMSVQHGTILFESEAPSNYQLSVEATFFGTLLGAAGYIAVVPDYIGYGASQNEPHPYEHRATLGRTCLDMLRAVREYAQQTQLVLDDRLFLAGYSEGGYATMCLHKLIEEAHPDEFSVTASAPGAGAYHKTAFSNYILTSQDNLVFINNYLWVLETYNRVYGFGLPWTYFLNSPYASQVAQNGVWINTQYNPQLLFTAQAREDLQNGTNPAFTAALADNDVYDWKPLAPLRMFHGTDDDFVPPFNAEDALAAMQARGATQVSLVLFEDKNHETALEDYVFGVLDFLQDF
ncbi:MAG: hypothetical protein OHK0053_07700 [Microscillaceae bacterium]